MTEENPVDINCYKYFVNNMPIAFKFVRLVVKIQYFFKLMWTIAVICLIIYLCYKPNQQDDQDEMLIDRNNNNSIDDHELAN